MSLQNLINADSPLATKSLFDGPFPPSPALTAPESQPEPNEEQVTSLAAEEGGPSLPPVIQQSAPQLNGIQNHSQPDQLGMPGSAGQLDVASGVADGGATSSRIPQEMPQMTMDIDQPAQRINSQPNSLPSDLAPHTDPLAFTRQDSTSSMAVIPPASPSSALPSDLTNTFPQSTSQKRLASDDFEDQSTSKRLRQDDPVQPGQSAPGPSSHVEISPALPAPSFDQEMTVPSFEQPAEFDQPVLGQPSYDMSAAPPVSLASDPPPAIVQPVVAQQAESALQPAQQNEPLPLFQPSDYQSTPLDSPMTAVQDQTPTAPVQEARPPVVVAQHYSQAQDVSAFHQPPSVLPGQTAPIANQSQPNDAQSPEQPSPSPADQDVEFVKPEQPFVQRQILPMSKEQSKYCANILKQLKKARDAPPFLAPVDPVFLGIPTYFNIVRDPMDLSTADKKLSNRLYVTVEQFIQDIRKIWQNCYLFNGEQAPVSVMAKNLEILFEKALPKMPSAEPRFAPSLPLSYSPGSSKGKKPIHGRKDSYPSDRPKRETHAPMNYDDLEPEIIPKKRRNPVHQSEDMKFCRDILRELTKKSNQTFAWPFMEPVDWFSLNLPDYPKLVKKPMDLGTMRSKLDHGQYGSAEAFLRDFKLVVKNCFIYNKPDSDVYRMGQQLDFTFDRKWAEKVDYSTDGDGAASDDQQAIDLMEQQLNMMRNNLRDLKDGKARRKAEKRANAVVQGLKQSRSSNSSVPKKPRKPSVSNLAGNFMPPKKKVKKRGSSDDEEPIIEVSYEMKRDLANGIASFEGDKLERAIDIIRKSRPDLLGDESKEIELDIDQLDERTLLKLYNFVVLGDKKKPRRSETLTAAGHKAGKGGRAGTGGLKGKSLNEDEESAKIRKLEEQLRSFEQSTGITPAEPSGSSSSDSSDSDDSASD